MPAGDHQHDGPHPEQPVRDQPRLERAIEADGARADPQPVQQPRSPGQAERDDGDHAERRQEGEHRLQIGAAAPADPEEPAAARTEWPVGPVGQEYGQRQVRDEDVPALQPLAAEQRQVGEHVADRGVPAQGQHDPGQRRDVPHEPLRRPWPQPDPGQQRECGDERQDPDVTRDLSQVVVREEGGLAERAGAAEQIRHQHQQQPPVRERAGIEQGHGARAPLGRADHGQAGQPLHRPEAGAQSQARGD